MMLCVRVPWLMQIVDLNKGLLMNENGQILQDSEGRPHRVVLGEDGQTIFGQSNTVMLIEKNVSSTQPAQGPPGWDPSPSQSFIIFT